MMVYAALSAVIAILLAVLLRRWIVPKYTVVQPYQQGVLTNRGVYERTLGPGGYWIPRWKMVTLVEMRRQLLNVAGQEVLTSEGISIKISLTGEYSVRDPKQSLFLTVQPATNLYFYVQYALREVVSSLTFDDVMASRNELNEQMLKLVKPQVEGLGLEMDALQVRDIMLGGDLKRAFAQTLTAQKEGQAALERARGETAALRNLANAAKLMEENPTLLQLRALQTMETSKGNTLVLQVGEKGMTVLPRS